jgi:hypothetical protein
MRNFTQLLTILFLICISYNAIAQTPVDPYENDRKKVMQWTGRTNKSLPITEASLTGLELDASSIQTVVKTKGQPLDPVDPTKVAVKYVFEYGTYYILLPTIREARYREATPAPEPTQARSNTPNSGSAIGNTPSPETVPQEKVDEILEEIKARMASTFILKPTYARDTETGEEKPVYGYDVDWERKTLLKRTNILLKDVAGEKEVLIEDKEGNELNILLAALYEANTVKEGLEWFLILTSKDILKSGLDQKENLAKIEKYFREYIPQALESLPAYVPYTMEQFDAMAQAASKFDRKNLKKKSKGSSTSALGEKKITY